MSKHKRHLPYKKIVPLFFATGIALVGVAVLIASHAATPVNNAIEPEAGTSSGNVRIDTATSGVSGTGYATFLAPPNTGGAGTCNNPIGSVSNRDTVPISGTPFEVRNEAWGLNSPGTQTTYACNEQSWYTIANVINNGGAVQTYPDSLYTISGSKTLGQYTSMTSTFGEAYQTVGDWDAGYDVWMNNWDAKKEMMIWNEWHGSQSYWATAATTAVTISGVPYHFVIIGSSEYVFVRDTQVKTGSVDILAALKWLVSKGYYSNSDVPTQIEYGVEICGTSGTQRFDTTAFTVNVN